MPGFSDAYHNTFLDSVFGSGSPATVYASDHSADPGGTGASEISGNGYARSPITNNSTAFPAAIAGSKSNGIDIVSPEATGSQGTITHKGFWTALTGGSFIAGGPLTVPREVVTGVILTVSAGDLTITIRRTT